MNEKTIRGKLIETELAYIAGFLDGEGCIAISRRGYPNPKWHAAYNLKLHFTNKDLDLLKFIQSKFGGAIMSKKRYSEKHNDAYNLTLTDNIALQAITELEPFVRIKKENAKVAIQFGNKINGVKFKRISDEEFNKREKLYAEMKSLNNRSRRD